MLAVAELFKYVFSAASHLCPSPAPSTKPSITGGQSVRDKEQHSEQLLNWIAAFLC